jgi:hypothetical protein
VLPGGLVPRIVTGPCSAFAYSELGVAAAERNPRAGLALRQAGPGVFSSPRPQYDANVCSDRLRAVAESPIPELVENRRPSVAMLPPGAPSLNRDEALELLGQLEAALVELRKLRAQGEVR